MDVEITLGDMQVRPAYAACGDLHEELPEGGRRHQSLDESQGLLIDGPGESTCQARMCVGIMTHPRRSSNHGL